MSVNGSGILTAAAGSTIEISGNLLGNTQNADDFNPQGTVIFDSGAGHDASRPSCSKPCRPTSAPSQAGFVNNFAYGTISLTTNTSVELVDQSPTRPAGSPRRCMPTS